MERLGVVMEGDRTDPDETLGVLNPASCRDRAGRLMLFPRVVADGNFSRIGRAEVRFAGGVPVGAQRQGYALEPTEGFERNASTAGVEDPRVTFIAALDRYVMTYTAFGPLGPRIALAISTDAHSWRRIGPIKFAYMPEYGTDFDLYPNKDAILFPEPVRDPQGRPALALIHRPDFNVAWWSNPPFAVPARGIAEQRPSIWISYAPLDAVLGDENRLLQWSDHHLLAVPEQPWEATKIGGDTPPVLTPHGWLTLYHGVGHTPRPHTPGQTVPIYRAGVLILDRDDPRIVRYRSPEPVLSPETDLEREGIVNNVVFPTAIDYSAEGWGDIYYGMADARIGVARFRIPATLPPYANGAIGAGLAGRVSARA